MGKSTLSLVTTFSGMLVAQFIVLGSLALSRQITISVDARAASFYPPPSNPSPLNAPQGAPQNPLRKGSVRPALTFGFDKPGPTWKRAIFKEDMLVAVGPYTSLRAPILLGSEGWPAAWSRAPIYTSSRLFFQKYHNRLKNLSLVPTVQHCLEKLSADPDRVAVIPSQSLSLKYRRLSSSFPVRLWVGWKEFSDPFLDRIGFNGPLNSRVAHILSRADPVRKRKPWTLKAVGDIMLGRRIGDLIQKSPHSIYPFEDIQTDIEAADLSIGNLECTISERGAPAPGKGYTFRGHPESLQRLAAAGFDLVSLANNHSLDFGRQAFEDTLTYLEKNNIAHVGGGKNFAEARQLKILLAPSGIRVGFLGYSMVVPKGFFAGPKKPGINWVHARRFNKEIESAKKECDVLVVQFHWGKEYVTEPLPVQRQYAQNAIDFGADLVIGHHPHWIQTIEFYKGKFIAYSLGNFVFDMTHRPKVTEGAILTAEFDGSKLIQARLDPVHLVKGAPRLVDWSLPQKRRPRQLILAEIFSESGLLAPIQTVKPPAPSLDSPIRTVYSYH